MVVFWNLPIITNQELSATVVTEAVKVEAAEP
jgi:hypothetical protein